MATPSQQPTSLSPPSQELLSMTQLLHLFHHRNKNQHRLSKWWKSFSQLRRQLGKLLTEVEALETCVKFSSAPASGSKAKKRKEKEVKGGAAGEGESKFVQAARETVEERVVFLERWVVPKCFIAFSNVVADNQYAALGLMLMGTLARVQSVLKELGREREDGNDEGVGEEKEVSREVKEGGDARETEIDVGEVVSRKAFLGTEADDDGIKSQKSKKSKKRREGLEWEESTAGAEPGGDASSAKRPKKKRKKGGDAFDDLFAGLI